ncbi:MAG: hypothetical protein PHD56_02220 [Anaerostipes sp.]|nr:hypothetical protein [Anaerostipes sp.]
MGEWELVDNPSCNLPEKVAEGFKEMFEDRIGSRFKPVMYCGSQRANGINYMLICEEKRATLTADRYYEKVILHLTMDGEWDILNIEILA